MKSSVHDVAVNALTVQPEVRIVPAFDEYFQRYTRKCYVAIVGKFKKRYEMHRDGYQYLTILIYLAKCSRPGCQL